MNALRLGIVGCGAISEWHAKALKKASRTNVVACIDPVAERAQHLAALTGATACASLEDAQVLGLDAVALLVPHHLHEKLALESFDAGLHVALEKPMSTDLASCERILSAAARDTTKVFMLAENAQYWPEVIAARELIDQGAIGEVFTARAWHHHGPPKEFYPDSDSWRFSAEASGGGVALDTGSHWIRPLRMLLGEIDEVVAITGRLWDEMEGESLVRSLLRFSNGTTASFDVILAKGAVALQPHFQFSGTKGEIVITVMGEVLLFDGKDWQGTCVHRGNYMESYAGVWQDFEAAVLDGKPLEADAQYSLGEIRTAQAIVRSGTTRQWEKVWS
ncbi:MAG: Gfo/Idh/MocA family oxidoreductase [Ilumatobacteraceae bacterium]|nr:Gfo/Idh/MocA family oxidoreductase [Ilumatobacteraceae bacterium]